MEKGEVSRSMRSRAHVSRRALGARCVPDRLPRMRQLFLPLASPLSRQSRCRNIIDAMRPIRKWLIRETGRHAFRVAFENLLGRSRVSSTNRNKRNQNFFVLLKSKFSERNSDVTCHGAHLTHAQFVCAITSENYSILIAFFVFFFLLSPPLRSHLVSFVRAKSSEAAEAEPQRRSVLLRSIVHDNRRVRVRGSIFRGGRSRLAFFRLGRDRWRMHHAGKSSGESVRRRGFRPSEGRCRTP